VHASDGEFGVRLERARRGDATAWSELYHQLAPLVIGYLRAQRLPDPDDVAGEVLLEVVRDLHRFTGDADGFRSWALTIAHHRLLDARRRDARRPATPTAHEQLRPTPSTDDPEAETLAVIGFGELEPALARLTDDQRTVLLLRVIGDLPIAEVARVTGRRQGAVKQLQRRAAAAMRRAIDEQGSQSTAGGYLDDPSDRRTGRDVVWPQDAQPETRTS
jgi:RNA polymerase sigma factor (sigma-70 family)